MNGNEFVVKFSPEAEACIGRLAEAICFAASALGYPADTVGASLSKASRSRDAARDGLLARIRELGLVLCGRSAEDKDWVSTALRKAGAASFDGLKTKDGDVLAAVLAAMEKRIKMKKEDGYE